MYSFFRWTVLICIFFHSTAFAALIIGTTRSISSSSGGGNSLPQVAINTNGKALSIWQKPFVNQVEAAVLESTVTSSPIILSSGNSPQVGIDQKGNGLAIFVSGANVVSATGAIIGPNQIVASRFNPVLGTWSAPVAITTSGTNSIPKISMNATGNAIIAWQVFPSTVQITSFNGTDNSFTTIQTLSGTGGFPQVSLNNNGAGFVVWQDFSSGLIIATNVTAS